MGTCESSGKRYLQSSLCDLDRMSKPGSFVLRMRMPYEFRSHKLATNNLHQLICAELLQTICCNKKPCDVFHSKPQWIILNDHTVGGLTVVCCVQCRFFSPHDVTLQAGSVYLSFQTIVMILNGQTVGGLTVVCCVCIHHMISLQAGLFFYNSKLV